MEAGALDREQLASALAQATRAALGRLHAADVGPLCAVALLTTGEALRPYLSVTCHGPDRWDLAGSPYAVWADDLFAPLEPRYAARGDLAAMTTDDAEREYDLRLGAMEDALRLLDREGLFGAGAARADVLLLVATMPPDETDAAFAHRLNTPGPLLTAWLHEAAEGPPAPKPASSSQ